jgi:hypothetical protein
VKRVRFEVFGNIMVFSTGFEDCGNINGRFSIWEDEIKEQEIRRRWNIRNQKTKYPDALVPCQGPLNTIHMMQERVSG